MPWIKQNENLYTHSEATFVMVKQSEKWVLIDTRDQSKAIPIDDIFNNPVFLINFENQVVLASHFRGEGANTPSTPAYSFKTEISSGLYRESAGVLAISVLGNKVLTIDSKPSFLCKAWVNFNGIGTVTIRESGNVSSITDNSTGDYTVNFTTAIPDDYCCTFGAQNALNTNVIFNTFVGIHPGFTPAVGSVRIRCVDTINNSSNLPEVSQSDPTIVCVAVFR